jgi:hypothetical protein
MTTRLPPCLRAAARPYRGDLRQRQAKRLRPAKRAAQARANNKAGAISREQAEST